MGKYAILNTPVHNIDGIAKVTGRAAYTFDVTLPRMLHGKILRSPYPHARLLSIDTSKAEGLAGVKGVATGKDTLGIKGGADLGLGDLSQPLKLTGTLAKPALDVSAAQASLALGKMLGGELAGLAGSIAGSKGKAERDFCLAAIETAKKGGKEAPRRKEKGAAEKAAEGLNGATGQAQERLKKIFGK